MVPPPAWPTCGRGLGAAGEAHSQPLPIKTWYEVKNRLLHIRIHRGAICIFYWDSYVHYLKPEKSIMGKEATSDLVRGREWGRERLGRRGGMGRDPLVLWGAHVHNLSPDYSEGPGESPSSSVVTHIPK